MVSREKFTIEITCPHCGQPGTVTWEENSIEKLARGPERAFITTSQGYHSQTGRTGSGDPLIVCDRCATIQPD